MPSAADGNNNRELSVNSSKITRRSAALLAIEPAKRSPNTRLKRDASITSGNGRPKKRKTKLERNSNRQLQANLSQNQEDTLARLGEIPEHLLALLTLNDDVKPAERDSPKHKWPKIVPQSNIFAAMEADFSELAEMDMNEIIAAGKSVFDSGRRCLKGGKKRKVIQAASLDMSGSSYGSTGSGCGWKINFKTVLKHLREKRMEKAASTEPSITVSNGSTLSLIPLSNGNNQLPQKDSSCHLAQGKDKEFNEEKFLANVSEAKLKKIWDCLTLSRSFPADEHEFSNLEDLEATKFLHYSLPKNEWFFGKFWFNQSKSELLRLMALRKRSRDSNALMSTCVTQLEPAPLSRSASAVSFSIPLNQQTGPGPILIDPKASNAKKLDRTEVFSSDFDNVPRSSENADHSDPAADQQNAALKTLLGSMNRETLSLLMNLQASGNSLTIESLQEQLQKAKAE